MIEERFLDEERELAVLREHYRFENIFMIIGDPTHVHFRAIPNEVRNAAPDKPSDYHPQFFTDAEIQAIGENSDGKESTRKKQFILGLLKVSLGSLLMAGL